MPDTLALYECHNKHCPLGSRKDPGRFTEGTTPELAETMGFSDQEKATEENPSGLIFGENVCPSCGEVGKKVGDHTSVNGSDPNQEVHDVIHEKVVAGEIEPEDTREVLKIAVDVLENNATIKKASTAVDHAIAEVVA